MAITEMYPRIPWELVADHLGSVEHTLGTAAFGRERRLYCVNAQDLCAGKLLRITTRYIALGCSYIFRCVSELMYYVISPNWKYYVYRYFTPTFCGKIRIRVYTSILVATVSFDRGVKLLAREKGWRQSYYYFMADARTCDVWATLAPLNLRLWNDVR